MTFVRVEDTADPQDKPEDDERQGYQVVILALLARTC
jgi:hypothetical protein